MPSVTTDKKVKKVSSEKVSKKKTSTEQPKEPVVSEQIVSEPVVSEPVVSEPVETTRVTNNDRFITVLEKLNGMKKEIASLIDDVKKLQKEKRKKNTNVKSGFSKQVDLSDKLKSFLNLPPDQLLSRVDVTRMVTDYIKENNLQITENKQHFRIDNKLSTLFDLVPGDELHYFKLQTHLKHHYPKTTSVTV